MLYGRPEASIDAQLKVIKAEPAPKMHKMETFIDFAMSTRNVTSEIQRTGMWQYMWNPPLMQELVDKLPYQMRMDWGQIKISTPNVNLADFSEWLFTRAKTACAVTVPTNKTEASGHVNTHTKSTNHNDKKSKGNPKLNTNSESTTCSACDGRAHTIYECRKFLGMSLNDKWETVKSRKLCRICLGTHHDLRCESNALCGESGCTVKHHRLLHNPKKTDRSTIQPTTQQPVQPTTKPKENTKTTENIHGAHQISNIVVLRRYIPVTLYGPNGSLNVLAFLDDGSDTTLVEKWVIDKLGINGEASDLFLEWTAKIVRKESKSKSVVIEISGTQAYHKRFVIKDVRTVKSLNLPSQTVNTDQLKEAFKFLRRIPIEGYENETPVILIGPKDCRLSTPIKTRSGKWDEPLATKTLLGWEVHGSNAPSARVSNVNFHAAGEMNDDQKLHQLVARYFALEDYGTKRPEATIENSSDNRAKKILVTTTKRIGNRFETGLLWKYDDVSLPDSMSMAKRRLLCLEKRLEKDPELELKLRIKFNEYIENGYVRMLDRREEAEHSKKTWYLPLFPVVNPKKPDKIRLVWDAAAKVGNVS